MELNILAWLTCLSLGYYSHLIINTAILTIRIGIDGDSCKKQNIKS